MKKGRIVSGEEGMLWSSFDTKKQLVNRISEALEYFTKKYDEVPAIVFINPKTLGDRDVKIKGIKIISDHKTLKNHFYVYCKKGK